MEKTFAEFNTDFYNKFEDPTIFDCCNFSTLKIVLDGLKVNYSKYKRRENFFLISWPLFKLISKIKFHLSWKRKYPNAKKELDIKLNSLSHKKFLVGYTNRSIKDNEGFDNNIYFSKIIESIGFESCLFVGADVSYKNKKPAYDLLKDELVIAQLFHNYTDEEVKLMHQLKDNFLHLKKQNIFSVVELKAIRTAYDLFFHQFKAWNYLFSNTNIQTAILTVHYHKEGLIYAAKMHNIRVVELQHGLIAEEDIFYILPQKVKAIIHKSLFADCILTYGNAWKNRLMKGVEYSEEQIKTIGYYHYQSSEVTNDENKITEIIGNKKVALFSTQTFMENTFIDYIKSIQNNIPEDFVVIIKPHPAEKIVLYQQAFAADENVIVVNCNLDFILSKSAFNITCYSTTVFDAMRHNLKSFAINFDRCQDYVQGFVNENLVVKVEPTENVFDKIELLNTLQINALDWYSPYSEQVLFEAIRNQA